MPWFSNPKIGLISYKLKITITNTR